MRGYGPLLNVLNTGCKVNVVILNYTSCKFGSGGFIFQAFSQCSLQSSFCSDRQLVICLFAFFSTFQMMLKKKHVSCFKTLSELDLYHYGLHSRRFDYRTTTEITIRGGIGNVTSYMSHHYGYHVKYGW